MAWNHPPNSNFGLVKTVSFEIENAGKIQRSQNPGRILREFLWKFPGFRIPFTKFKLWHPNKWNQSIFTLPFTHIQFWGTVPESYWEKNLLGSGLPKVPYVVPYCTRGKIIWKLITNMYLKKEKKIRWYIIKTLFILPTILRMEAQWQNVWWEGFPNLPNF